MTTFRTVLQPMGGNNVAIVVPEEIVLGFGQGKRVPVTVTVDGGYSYRNTIASMGGRFLISFNAATRSATGNAAGDEVEITLELDDQPRTVEVPAQLSAALADNPTAAEAWAKLSYTKQREHAESITGAKTDATRDRRLAKILDVLANR